MANEPVQTPTPVGDQRANTSADYVRTFAKDMARVSGNAPAATAPAKTAAKQKKKEEKSAQKEEGQKTPPPPPEPPPAIIPPKAPSTDETKEEVLARLKAKVAQHQQTKESAPMSVMPSGPVAPIVPLTPKPPAAATPPMPPPVPAPAPEPVVPRAPARPRPQPPPPAPLKEEKKEPERLHTYKSDFADHVDAKDASTFSVLAAQADAGRVDTVSFVEKKPFPFAVVLGAMFIVLGVGVVYTALALRPQELIVPQEVIVPSLIFSDSYQEVAGEGLVLRTAFLALAAKPLENNKTVVAYLTQATTSPEGITAFEPQQGGVLVRALALPAPEVLLRSLQEESTSGFIHTQEETSPFFLLRTDSFERSFAGMLSWESRIASDLAAFYPPLPAVTTPTSLATSSASSSTPPIRASSFAILRGFTDDIVENRDVRVLRDGAGRAVLLYGYHDKETLVIARNEGAFRELVRRLLSSREP